jgi:hypothetical protein
MQKSSVAIYPINEDKAMAIRQLPGFGNEWIINSDDRSKLRNERLLIYWIAISPNQISVH